MASMDGSEHGDSTQELRREVARLAARIDRLEEHLRNQPARDIPNEDARHPAAASQRQEREGAPGSAVAPAAQTFKPPARPSLESRIGSQVFSRVGIVAVLIGVAWFLKYAVDQHWLGPSARVLVGLAAGAGLIAWSEWFRRRSFPIFSFSLKAVGTGILYLSLWAASALFGLVPYSVALLGMALVTAGNAWLCLAQRSQVLAAYALTGGFLTPALLGLGHSSVAVLGLYLILLNTGLFCLLAVRKWPRLLPAAFAGTIAYLLWLGVGGAAVHSTADSLAALALAVFFFLAFSLGSVLLVGSDVEAQRLAGGTAIANALAGGLAVWLLLGALAPRPSPVQPWMGCLEACWLAGLLFTRRLRGPAWRVSAEVHAGLVIAVAALGMWLALSRAGVLAGVTGEAATLLGLSIWRRTGPAEAVLDSPVAPAVLLVLAACGLVVESGFHLLPHAAHVLVNVRFTLFVLAIAAAVFGVRVAARHHAAEQGHASPWTRAGVLFALLSTALLLAAGVFEMRTYWGGSGAMAEQIAVSAWAALLGVVLLVIGFRVRWAFLRWQALALLTLAVAKVFLVDTRALTQGYRIASFLGLGVLLLCVSFIYQRDLLHLRGEEHGGE